MRTFIAFCALCGTLQAATIFNQPVAESQFGWDIRSGEVWAQRVDITEETRITSVRMLLNRKDWPDDERTEASTSYMGYLGAGATPSRIMTPTLHYFDDSSLFTSGDEFRWSAAYLEHPAMEPVVLQPGTHWFGVTANGEDLGYFSGAVNGKVTTDGPTGRVYFLGRSGWTPSDEVADLAIVVEGHSLVPEPTAVVLALFALPVLAGRYRPVKMR